MNSHLIRNALALLVIHSAILMGWQWVWGVLFMVWTMPALYTGEVRLIGPVTKEVNPVMFWLILLTWIGLSEFLIVADLIPLIQSST